MIERDFVKEPLQVLSFGGGTQSTAMLLFIHEGKLPKPDIILFADTGSEDQKTLDHVENVARPFVEDVLGIQFEVVRSHRGSLHEDYMRLGRIPVIGARSCTGNFKILPQRRRVREIVGNKRGILLAQFWLGITTDEDRRRAESDVQWAGLKYPLLDDFPVSRSDCIAINEKYGWDVVKSGCVICPYQGARTWRKIRDEQPEWFAIALEMERLAQERCKEEGRTLRTGLCREWPISDLDNLPAKYDDDSSCDSDAGCFI